MKNILLSTAAAVMALSSVAAQAQTHNSANEQTTYSAPDIAAVAAIPAIAPTPPTHSSYVFDYKTLQFTYVPGTPGTPGSPAVPGTPEVTPAQQYANNIGSRYTQTGTAPNDADTASATADANKQTFNLSGTVNQDCSFYNGGSAIHTMALNTIGVRTNSDANVANAFNQVSDITANFNTATAGCNTRNTVTITSGGALLNSSAQDYDPDQFTNKIPYSVTATWTGAATSGHSSGSVAQTLATTTSGSAQTVTKQSGAWRSAFNIAVLAPAQSLGLVAGGYSDQVVVTLAAS